MNITINELKKVVEPIESFLEKYYLMFPDREPKEDRKFDDDRVDYDFQEERDNFKVSEEDEVNL